MLKKNILSNYIGQGWNALMNFAFIPIYVKYIGIESYGIIGIFGLLQVWFSLLDLGLTPTLGREMALYSGGKHSDYSIRDLMRSIEVIVIIAAILISVSFILSSNWLATSWIKNNSIPVKTISEAFTIMGVVASLRFVEDIYKSAIIGLQRQVYLNLITSLVSTFRGIGALIIVIYFSPTIKAFFLWQCFISIIMLTILSISTYKLLPKINRSARFSFKSLRNVWKFASGIMLVTILGMILTQVDKILLSKILSLKDFGYYTLATSVSGALFVFITPIMTAIYPKLCKSISNETEIDTIENYHKGAQLVSIIIGSIAIVLIFFSNTFLILWTHNQIISDEVSKYLKILVFGNMLNCLFWIPHQTQLAYGWTKLSIFSNSIAILFIIPAILFFVPKFGIIGAAWIWVFLNIGYVFISAHFMFKKILVSEKYNWYINDIFIPLAPCFIFIGFLSKLIKPGQNISYHIITLITVSIIALFTTISFSSYYSKYTISYIKKILIKFN